MSACTRTLLRHGSFSAVRGQGLLAYAPPRRQAVLPSRGVVGCHLDTVNRARGSLRVFSSSGSSIPSIPPEGPGNEQVIGPDHQLTSGTEQEQVIGPDHQLTSGAEKYDGLKVLVVGATGGVGKNVVKALVERQVPVRAAVRDLGKGSKLLGSLVSQGVELVKADVYQYSTLPAAFGDSNVVICCTGFSDYTDPLGPFNVDFQGTLNLVALAQQRKVKHFVLVSSIGTDDILNPLNLVWGVLFWKKRAEEALQRSGLNYTIVRPGGLKSELRPGEVKGNIVMGGPREFGFTPFEPTKRIGSILRSQVAEVCVDALVEPAAANKVVEIVTDVTAPPLTLTQMFESVQP